MRLFIKTISNIQQLLNYVSDIIYQFLNYICTLLDIQCGRERRKLYNIFCDAVFAAV